jgi:general stress protein YciG
MSLTSNESPGKNRHSGNDEHNSGKRECFYMDDLTSRDDEKRQELARELGRQEEQKLQRERELATEKGRKQGQDEERARENAREKPKEGWGMGIKIIASLVVLAIIAAVVALLSLSVSVMPVTTSYAMPFTTNYAVTFPEGQSIAIGNSHMTVLSYQNELISDIDGDRQKLVAGEDRVISERRAMITTFGVIKLVDTNFQINLKYKGNRDNLAYFDMAIHTSQQVPDMLLKQLLPAEIHAQPM